MTGKEIEHKTQNNMLARVLIDMKSWQQNAGQETEMTRVLREMRNWQNQPCGILPGTTRAELEKIKADFQNALIGADRKRRTQEMMDQAREKIMESVKIRKVCCHQTCALPAVEYQDGKIIVFNEHRGQKHVNHIDIDWICEQAARDGRTDEIIEKLRRAKTL